MSTRTEAALPTLPCSTRDLIDAVPARRRHAGLQLDKLSAAGEMELQKRALTDVTRTATDEMLLRTLLDRRRLMLDALRATRLVMTTRGSLTLHLSRSGALENAGIAMHPLYGFVYLPGSGVKGMTRAWAETVWAPTQPDPERAWRQIEAAFGWSPGSERHKRVWRPSDVKPPPGAAAGRLLFHDAWPLRWPRLLVDIVNNHHVAYYAGEDDPGDWEDPIPISFLAVGVGQPFEFAISDRTGGDDGLLEGACGWLRDALTVQGAGAKTAAGYGRFNPARSDPSVTVPTHIANVTCELKLVTPAFLAGGDQQKADCDLRPATLRGLLRWWWAHDARCPPRPGVPSEPGDRRVGGSRAIGKSTEESGARSRRLRPGWGTGATSRQAGCAIQERP